MLIHTVIQSILWHAPGPKMIEMKGISQKLQNMKNFLFGRYMSTKWQVRNKNLEAREKAWAWRHEWGGTRVYQLILDMSGFYVKSAQILASKAVSSFVCEFLECFVYE
mgnify:CR=1 FL=1